MSIDDFILELKLKNWNKNDTKDASTVTDQNMQTIEPFPNASTSTDDLIEKLDV